MGKPRQSSPQHEFVAPTELTSAAEEAGRTLETAHQNQDQEYNQYQPESSATVVARAIEGTASDSTETSKQCDNDDDE
jgi:F0F1-type ATP synthase membrane subunit b/b'